MRGLPLFDPSVYFVSHSNHEKTELNTSQKETKESTCLIKNRKTCHRITITSDTERHALVCASLCNTSPPTKKMCVHTHHQQNKSKKKIKIKRYRGKKN